MLFQKQFSPETLIAMKINLTLLIIDTLYLSMYLKVKQIV